MKIDSYTTKEELVAGFGVTLAEAYYLKNILIDECRSDTDSIGTADMAQIIETAKRFAEENE